MPKRPEAPNHGDEAEGEDEPRHPLNRVRLLEVCWRVGVDVEGADFLGLEEGRPPLVLLLFELLHQRLSEVPHVVPVCVMCEIN